MAAGSELNKEALEAATPGPWQAEPEAGRGAWIKGSTGEWAALSCGDTDASARANAALIVVAVNAYRDPSSPPRAEVELADLVLEIADKIDGAAEDIGTGGRSPLTVLREAVPIAESIRKNASAPRQSQRSAGDLHPVVGYSHINKTWFVKYPYASEEDARRAALATADREGKGDAGR